MNGILRLAFKLLVNDSAKFTALTVGITFSVLLMIEMTSLFAGILIMLMTIISFIIGCRFPAGPSMRSSSRTWANSAR